MALFIGNWEKPPRQCRREIHNLNVKAERGDKTVN